MHSNPTPSSAKRFFEIVEALCRAVGCAIRPGFIQAAMALLVVRRLHRVRRGLLALEARFLAGQVLRKPAPPPAPVLEPESLAEILPRRVRVAPGRLPSRLGWLCPLVPSEAACYAGQLRLVLAEPGMQALLASCPQAVRLLGPLCRMLGIARTEFVPGGADVAPLRVKRVRAARARPAEVDWAAEDAHYAFTRVPRRFRLRVG